MVEMLGVLAIIGVLSVGGIAGYSKAMHRYRLNKTIEQITQIAASVRTFFAPQKNYYGLYVGGAGSKLLKKAKLIPEEMWDGNSLSHIYGGRFSIVSSYLNSTSECINDDVCSVQAFLMLMYNLPEDVCIDLVSHDWSNAGVNMIIVRNASINNYLATPINIKYAVKVCEVLDDDTDGVDTVEFEFDVDITKGNWVTNITSTRNRLDAM